MVIGIDKNKLKNLSTYQEWAKLGDNIKQVKGVKAVVSIARLNDLTLNDSLGKFEFKPLQPTFPKSQPELDELIQKYHLSNFTKALYLVRKLIQH